RNAPVEVCASSDGSSCSKSSDWARWIVRGMDNVSGKWEIIRDDSSSGDMQLSGAADVTVFKATRLIAAQTSVVACMPTSKPANNQRELTVMISGVVSIAPKNGSGACP